MLRVKTVDNLFFSHSCPFIIYHHPTIRHYKPILLMKCRQISSYSIDVLHNEFSWTLPFMWVIYYYRRRRPEHDKCYQPFWLGNLKRKYYLKVKFWEKACQETNRQLGGLKDLPLVVLIYVSYRSDIAWQNEPFYRWECSSCSAVLPKADYLLHVFPSVRPSAWNNSAPTDRIFMKFDIWVFSENHSRQFDFH